MSTTEIINQTTKALKLKVGNNLVFTDLTVVQKDSSYKVHVDPNATYQEYFMGVDRNGKVLIINSDECADSKSITIIEEADGTYRAQKVPRTPTPALTAAASAKAGFKKSPPWKFWSKS